jgi:enterochelin esterase-like enzyme
MVQGARRLHEVLAARGWPVQYREDADAGHDEASWAAGVEAMLRWLYGPPPAR